MADNRSDLITVVDAELAVQQIELAETRNRQLLTVFSKTATGTGDIDNVFWLDRKFRLVFVRCHFVGGTGTAPLSLFVDSASGSAYDAQLFTISAAGVSQDVHLRIGGGDTDDPSAWTFQAGDDVRVKWTNPNSGTMTWGLEVGLSLAS